MLAALLSALITLLLYLSLLLVGLWIWFHWSHRSFLQAAAKIPVTLPTVPLLGHAYVILKGQEEIALAVVQMVIDAVAKGISNVCVWIGPLPFVLVGDMEDIQTIIGGNNASDKSDEYDYFVSGLDSGVGPFRYNVVSARGQTWKTIRRHLNPMFHPQNVTHLVPVFNANSRELTTRLQRHLGRGHFDVTEYTMDLALKTICNLIYGPDIPISVESKSFKDFRKVVEQVPELFIKRLLHPWLKFDLIFQLLYRKQVKQINTSWKNITEDLLKTAKEQKKQQKEKKNSINYKESSNNEKEGPMDILDAYAILCQNYPEFNEADMRCDMFCLYLTGTDTVGTATAFCLLALAQYQDIQEKLYREIVSVVGAKDEVNLEDLARMPYLDQVIKESLRKFLIVPFLQRKLIKDVELSTGKLQAGNNVIFSIATLHMNPKIYPNPNKFDPERWSPENSLGREKFTFIPFSGGPRICIAKHYAMQLMKIQIVHILRSFRLTTNQDSNNLKRKLIITLASAEGCNVSVEKRSLDKNIVGND